MEPFDELEEELLTADLYVRYPLSHQNSIFLRKLREKKNMEPFDELGAEPISADLYVRKGREKKNMEPFDELEEELLIADLYVRYPQLYKNHEGFTSDDFAGQAIGPPLPIQCSS